MLVVGSILVAIIIVLAIYISVRYRGSLYGISLSSSVLAAGILLAFVAKTYLLHTTEQVCINRVYTERCHSVPAVPLNLFLFAFIFAGIGLLLSYQKHSNNTGNKKSKKRDNSAGINPYAIGAISVFIVGYLELLAGFYGWVPVLNNANNNNSVVLFYFLSVVFVVCTFYAFYSRKKSLAPSILLTMSAVLLAFVFLVITAVMVALSEL